MRKWWNNYSLSIVLFCLFLLTWIAQFFAEWKEVWNDTQAHNQVFTWSEFWPKFFSSTLQNWQSEFLQLFTFVILTAFLVHRGSAESRDGQDRIERKLDEIVRNLKSKEK